MRDGFRFPLVHDVWRPLASMPGLASNPRSARDLRVAARLAPGVGLGRARDEMTGVAKRLAQEYPATNQNVKATVDRFTGGFSLANPWTAMLAAVTIVLLIACANLANLLLSRAAHRSREIAIRSSLGATRWRIVRQLLVESLLLALGGAALGLVVAVIGVRLWTASMPPANWPYWYHFAIDWRIVSYIAEVAVAAVILFGVGPAILVSKPGGTAGLH